MCYKIKVVSQELLFLPKMKITNYIPVRIGLLVVYGSLRRIGHEIVYTHTQQGGSGRL